MGKLSFSGQSFLIISNWWGIMKDGFISEEKARFIGKVKY